MYRYNERDGCIENVRKIVKEREKKKKGERKRTRRNINNEHKIKQQIISNVCDTDENRITTTQHIYTKEDLCPNKIKGKIENSNQIVKATACIGKYNAIF